MIFSSADQLLRRWARMGEQLESPRAASGVLHSGLVYARQCSRCPGTSWIAKGIGKSQQRTYHPVCQRCGRDWPVDRADIRVGQVDCRRTGGLDAKFADFAHLTLIVQRPGLWERRTWFCRVLGHTAGSLDYDQVADQLRHRFPRKHVSCPGGFFTPRHCRTLVYRARDVVEDRARRLGIWHDEIIYAAAER